MSESSINNIRRTLNLNSTIESNKKKCVIPQFVKNDYIECMLNSKKTCPICLEEYNMDCGIEILDCGHSLCTCCFKTTGTTCFMRCT